MKTITLLFILSSLSLFAAEQTCQLSYENKLEIVRVISERIYPDDTYGEDIDIVRETYYRYSRELRNLMDDIADNQGAHLDSPEEVMFYFDDFKASELVGGIVLVDYGVGGGNGGITYFKDGLVVADYFDGELLHCDSAYISTTY